MWQKSRVRAGSALGILSLLYAFLVGLEALGAGFELLGGDIVDAFFAATRNPFAGLAIGILTTSVMQSSSATTSMVVAIVANPTAPLPIENAVPMVMGANIGTTVTNTLVSFGHVARPDEFRRAMAFGTLDDFFNLCALVVLLPLEILFAPLERVSGILVSWIPDLSGSAFPNPIKATVNWLVEPLQDVLTSSLPTTAAGILLLALAMLTIFFGLNGLVASLRSVGEGRARAMVRRALGKKAWRGFALGLTATAVVQSSSVVLSLLVPVAGTGALTLAQGFPIALGANVGTTLTALLAAAGAAPSTLPSAIQIALVHLLFNAAGAAIFYPTPSLRRIPMGMAQWLAEVAVQSKFRALLYLAALFYGIPALGLIVM